MIGRRDFITLLGGAAVPWPLAARAQQGERVRRIGWLGISRAPVPPLMLHAFKRGLRDLGWIEGRNLAFEERWADGRPERAPSLSAELVAARPDLIFVIGSVSLTAVRRATGTIPILIVGVADPVGQGFVSSLAQPGGNITGFAGDEFEVSTKKLDLLPKIAPGLKRVIFMYDPTQPAAVGQFAQVEVAAARLGLTLSKAPVRDPNEIEHALETAAQAPNAGLFLVPSSAVFTNQGLLVSAAIRYRLPAIHSYRNFVEAGGLASYGEDDLDLARRAAGYADRILKGEKPADLPVQLPTKFEFVLNLKTAKTIGLIIPDSVLALADEVIE
jgi:putative ABC transport system substrate-binding protein